MGAATRCVSDPAGPLLARTLPEPPRAAPPWQPLLEDSRQPADLGESRLSPGSHQWVPGARCLCRARAPAGSNLRADGSMICTQAGAAKVSVRRAGNLPGPWPLSPSHNASGPSLRGFRTAPEAAAAPSPELGSTQLPTFSLLRRGSIVTVGHAAAQAGLASLGGDRSFGIAGAPGPPFGQGEKQRSPQAGSQRLPRLSAPSQ